MKAIFITREIKVNGITYYEGTTLTKACCEFIANNKRFPNVNDVTAWWATMISPVNNKTAEKVLQVFEDTFGESYILNCKEYTII